MGLDSVELLMDFENYFSISVPDLEAEKIATIQNMVDFVSKARQIFSEDSILKEKVRIQFQQIISNSPPLNKDDLIFVRFHPSNKLFWSAIENKLELKLPMPNWTNGSSISKLFNWLTKPNYDWESIKVDRFIDVVCFANYKTFIKSSEITSKYEILVAIAGITQEKCGVDFYEIFPEKGFVKDFGID